MSRMIPLTQGKWSIVDDDVFVWLSHWIWHVKKERSRKNYYAVRNNRIDGENKTICLHRAILGLDLGDKRQVDHINGNTLDNRRCNLRIATNAENMRNRGKNANNTSGYKGVYWHRQSKKWGAQIMVNGKHMSLGLFHDSKKAALVYDQAAKKYFGEFAHLNFD